MAAKLKSVEEMTPEEREAEHLRGLRELIEATKSGVLVKKKSSPSAEPTTDESGKKRRESFSER